MRAFELTCEAKTTVKEGQRRRRRQQRPYYNQQDACYLIPREDRVIIVRLRTGHCRLRHHMCTKLYIGHSVVCPWWCISNDSTTPAAELSDPPESSSRDLGSVSWRPTTVKWRQFSHSNRHSTIGTRQTEYHEALPSSVNLQSHLTSSFADYGNASWYLVCRVSMVEWRLDRENCSHLMVIGLHDTGPWPSGTPVRLKLYGPLPDPLRTAAFVRVTGVAVWENDEGLTCQRGKVGHSWTVHAATLHHL